MLGRSGPQQPAPIRYSGLNVSSSQLDLPIPVFWGQRRLPTNAIDFVDFTQHAVKGKGKGGGAKGQQAYDYTAATVLALCEGPIDSIARAWASGSTTTTTTLSALGMVLFAGTAAQSPWAWMASHHADHALAYAYTAYLGCEKQDLGASATIPDNEFECVRAAGFAYTHTTPGWIDPSTHIQASAIDVLLSDCATDLLTNPQYKALLVSGDLGDMTQWATYTRAQGLFYSPLLNSSEKVTSILGRWAEISNTWIYCDGRQIQFVPLGDKAITANGVTYTPDLDVAYDLGLDDFADPAQPVVIHISDPADRFNRTVLNITDRTIGYVNNPFEYKDQTLGDDLGQRDSKNVQADEICDPEVAKIVVQLIGRRAAYISRDYEFKLSYRFLRILPGTIVTLTEPNQGLDHFPVRITDVGEDDNGVLSLKAEELPGIANHAAASAPATSGPVPTTPNQLVAPGHVNTPAIAEPDSSFTGGAPRILIAASGGANWGGCQVQISFDATSYQHAGDITAPAVQGLLTANLADHADPDTTNTLHVDCTESLAAPDPVTTADADAGRTLALVAAQPSLVSGSYVVPTNGELIAFGDVTPTGTYSADLTYLRRARNGSAHSAHSTGDQFTVLDILGQSGTTLEYELPQQYVGQPIYLKFLSFNVFGLSLEDPATVNEYKYTPTGAGYGAGAAGAPMMPTGLTLTPGPTQNIAAWTANASADNVTSYKLYRATGTGGSFGSAVLIWQGLALTFTDTGLAGGAGFTYFLEAVNVVGASGPTSGVNATSAATVLPLAHNDIYVGDSGGHANAVAMSGDATIADTGAVTVTKSGGTPFGAAAFHPATDFDAAGAASAAQAAATTAAEAYTDGRIKAPCPVASLGTPTNGLRGFATDATVALSSTSLGTAVVGGGTNKVPVYADGAAWLIGG